MYKKLLGVVLFAFSLVLSQTTFADSWGCGEGLKSMLAKINLTADQKTKIKPILDKLKSDLKDNASQMKDLDKQIHDQVVSAKMDEDTVNGLVDKKATLIGNMMKAKISAKNQIINILTADQKTKLQGMMDKLEDKIAAKFKSCHEKDDE